MDMGLKDKVVLITGGGGGIARGIERAFATEGAKFILTDLFPGGLEAAKEELERDFGSEVFTILANGSVEEEVRAASKRARALRRAHRRPDQQRAGVASGLTLVQHSEEDFDLAVRSGLYATFFYMKHAYLPEGDGGIRHQLRFRRGHRRQSRTELLRCGERGHPGHEPRGRIGVGPDNINVNIVCPIVMTKALEEWREREPEMYEKNVKAIPLGRFGDARRT